MSASTTATAAAAVELVPCQDCGRMVPESNLTIHRAHACCGRARPASVSTDEAEEQPNGKDNKKNINSASNDDNNDVIDLSSSPESAATTSGRKRYDDEPSSPQPRRRQRRQQGRLKRDDDYDNNANSASSSDNDISIEDSDADDKMDTDDDEGEEKQRQSNVVDLLGDDDDEWSCPRCTLLNDQSASTCDACGYRSSNQVAGAATSRSSNNYIDGIRPADPVRRERLIGGDSPQSPLSIVGSSALLGGVLGAAGAYMSGRPMGRGALEGGVAGAVGGALMSEVMRTPDRPSAAAAAAQNIYQNDNDSPLSLARSAGANGQPAYPVLGGTSTRRSTRQPRPSVRVSRVTDPNGYTTTVVQSSGRNGTTRFVRRSTTGPRDHNHDQLLGLLMHSVMSNGGGAPPRFGGGPGGVDRMSYEQLLAAFGDGTENLGASNGAIASLPAAVVQMKDGNVDLPPDACQCSICLEDFEGGQTRKMLPCLHGFHTDCVDKWLKTNGACPVCKFRVDQRDRDDS